MWATRAKAAFIPSPLPPIGLGAVAPGRPESGGKKQRVTRTRGGGVSLKCVRKTDEPQRKGVWLL